MKNIPTAEELCVSYYNVSGKRVFLVTFNPTNGFYSLYRIETDGFTRLGKSKSPLELEEKFEIAKEIAEE